jgi:hypothetical protein
VNKFPDGLDTYLIEEQYAKVKHVVLQWCEGVKHQLK